MGYYRKNPNRGVEDGHEISKGVEKKKNVKIAGVNKIRSGIFLE